MPTAARLVQPTPLSAKAMPAVVPTAKECEPGLAARLPRGGFPVRKLNPNILKHQLYLKLKVFVASPGDVAEERERVTKVTEKLNRSGSIADQFGVVLETVRWETHVAPLMGRPQEVVLQQLPVDRWDIFIGILWTRFGTPTGTQNPNTGKEYSSGTEEEFSLAYESWKRYGKPQISFYRCVRMPGERFDHIDPLELQRVKDFFSDFEKDGQHPGLHSKFSDAHDFENLLAENLATVLQRFAGDIERQRAELAGKYVYNGESAQLTSAMPSAIPSSTPTRPSLVSEMREGQFYDVVFLSVDISDHSEIVHRHRHNPASVQQTLKNFKRFATIAAAHHGGDIFSWAGDGGILIFAGELHCERAALAGVRLLHELTIFNLDRKK